MSNNWFNMMNPVLPAIKKFVYDLIGGQRYSNHVEILEQVARNFNEKEYQKFGNFIAEVFEAGYMRSIDEHQAELKRLGVKFTLRPTTKSAESQPIFKKNQPDNQ